MQSTIFQVLLGTCAILLVIALIQTYRSRRTMKRGLEMLSQDRDIIHGLSKDFINTSLVNFNDGSFRVLWNNADFDVDISSLKNIEEYSVKIHALADSFVIPEERNAFIQSLNLENIRNDLVDKDVMYVDSTFIVDGVLHYYQIKIIKIDESRALFGLHCVDGQKSKERQELEFLENEITDRTIELKKRGDALSRLNDETIVFIGGIIESRDIENSGHVNRVRTLTNILANQVMEAYPEYGLTSESVNLITSVSALHDIGKIRIPDSILFKPGPLSSSERTEMQTHCEEGCNVLLMAPEGWGEEYKKMGMEIVRYHHERYDGNGYPDGLKGDEIPVSAQIVGLAECYDALTSDSVYRKAFSCDKAYEMIMNDECGVMSDKMKHCLTACRDKLDDYILNSSEFPFASEISPYVFKDTLNGLKIMIVEDNEINSQITKEILEEEGAVVITAENGLDCLSKLSGMPNGTLDAILMDINMPVMDGLEATRRIRKSELSIGYTIPIIAMTASTSEESIKEALDAGMNAFLTKPVRVASLTKALLENMRNRYKSVQRELTQVNILANTDALTGVKNATAYMASIESLNEEIRTKDKLHFAVVLCDVNGLKIINDKFGHDIGDNYIINSCRIICRIFGHSPVFRIGGDEFAVMITGRDYEKRKELFKELRNHNEKYLTSNEILHGKGAFSCGMSDYIPGEDTVTSEIIKRADVELYAHKQTYN